MMRRKIGNLMAATAFVFAACLSGVGSIGALAETGSDLNNDVRAGEAGESTTANDVDTAEEVNGDGEFETVDETDNGTHGADGTVGTQTS